MLSRQKTTIRPIIAAVSMLAAMILPGQTMAQEQVFELRLVHNYSTTHYLAKQAIQPWIDQVEANSQGRIKIKTYPASQLGKEQSNLLRYGLADLALIVPSAEASRMPLSSAIELPIDLGDSCQASERIWSAVAEDQPLYREELQGLGMQPIFAFSMPPYAILTTKRKVEKMEDMAGLKLRANGGAISKTMRELSVVPLSISSSEIYDAMSRGTIDGAYLPLNAVPSYSLEKEVGYFVEGVNLGNAADYFVASARTWRQLPPDLQQVMLDAGRQTQSDLCQWFISNQNETRDQLIATGVHNVQLDDAESARWLQQVDTVVGDWIETMQTRNRSGRAVVESLIGGGQGS